VATKPTTLMILNFVMDEEHPVLSHQVGIVNALGTKFEKVVVVTGSCNPRTSVGSNIQIFNSRWIEGQNSRNVWRFYRQFLIAVRTSNQIGVVFSHMSVVQSILAAPILLRKRIPHILWYAHTAQSLPLRIAHILVQRILTSTPGSCPISGSKVKAIGQGIDSDFFQSSRHVTSSLLRAVHIGRADRSKQIDLMVEQIKELRDASNLDISLDLFGSPSNQVELHWFNQFKMKILPYTTQGWLRIHPSIIRKDVPRILTSMDVFVHAFHGSLDKTLIEATLSKIPVVTSNQEFLKIFGSWGVASDNSIVSQYSVLLTLPTEELQDEIERRYQIAVQSHSLAFWIDSIYSELVDFPRFQRYFR